MAIAELRNTVQEHEAKFKTTQTEMEPLRCVITEAVAVFVSDWNERQDGCATDQCFEAIKRMSEEQVKSLRTDLVTHNSKTKLLVEEELSASGIWLHTFDINRNALEFAGGDRRADRYFNSQLDTICRRLMWSVGDIFVRHGVLLKGSRMNWVKHSLESKFRGGLVYSKELGAAVLEYGSKANNLVTILMNLQMTSTAVSRAEAADLWDRSKP